MPRPGSVPFGFSLRPIAPSVALIVGAIALWLCLVLPASAQRVIEIADDTALRAAMAGDVTGAELRLAPGIYPKVTLKPGKAPAVLRSADPSDPAVITWFSATEFDGLVVEDIVFDYTYKPDHKLSIRPFRFAKGRNLAVRNLRVVGDVARNRDEIADGLGFGIGLSFQGIQGLEVRGLHISRFYRGLVIGGCRDVHVVGNELVGLRMDGMNFSSVQRVLIEDNLVHDFDRSADPRDHADMIQFWTNRTTVPTEDVVIRRNVLNSGNGNGTQTIFMRNDMVDRGLAGDELFYRNILIEHNVILNSHLHGITVGETDGLIIRHNTLLQNLASAGSEPQKVVRIPRINLSAKSRNVIVTDNITSNVVGLPKAPANSVRWRIANNLFVQNTSLMQPNHYAQIFDPFPQGDPGAIETYRYRADGPAAGARVGAARLAR